MIACYMLLILCCLINTTSGTLLNTDGLKESIDLVLHKHERKCRFICHKNYVICAKQYKVDVVSRNKKLLAGYNMTDDCHKGTVFCKKLCTVIYTPNTRK